MAHDMVIDIHEHFALDTAARHTRGVLRQAILDIPDFVHAARNTDRETVVDLLEVMALRLDRVYRELDETLRKLDGR